MDSRAYAFHTTICRLNSYNGLVKDADAVIQQFYPGELGGLALAEVVFGDVNPSGMIIHVIESCGTQIRLTRTIRTGKLPVSFPRSVGTTPVFYNYIKGSRPLDPGVIYDNGTLQFGHQVSYLIVWDGAVSDNHT